MSVKAIVCARVRLGSHDQYPALAQHVDPSPTVSIRNTSGAGRPRLRRRVGERGGQPTRRGRSTIGAAAISAVSSERRLESPRATAYTFVAQQRRVIGRGVAVR